MFGLALAGGRAPVMKAAGLRCLRRHHAIRPSCACLLLRWMKQSGIQIVHCHKSSDSLLAALLGTISSFRLIFTEHMGSKRPKKDPLHR